ncbi:dihydrofolate reductase family protein [Microlunatus aurantiacus]|uniref:Dihydrofolate reductase family protein n=1 Tax=Microlunatus aurantiacus TaxID=446786 RepID=A0ABP7CXW4_9ACTN
MRRLTYLIGVTVDGFIAGPGDQIDFFPTPAPYLEHLATEYPETMPTHVRGALGIADAPNRRWDTVIMGRGTYEPALALGITSPYAHLRQLVVSTTLGTDDPAVEVVAADPVARVRELKAEPGLDLYLAGGAALAGALVDEIDELVIKLYPVLAGSGVHVVAGAGFAPRALERVAARSFDSGHMITEYRRP